MAIPFFGPFVAWVPPVIVALLAKPGEHGCRRSILMGVGWLIVMNVLQPRLMQEAVGIHPIVVLGSVLIGGQDRRASPARSSGSRSPRSCRRSSSTSSAMTRDPSPVAARAAKRVEAREGRPVRIPREPVPGIDSDVT